MNIQQIHHVAYRCRNAKQTVKWNVLEAWSQTQQAPEHVAWLHQDKIKQVN